MDEKLIRADSPGTGISMVYVTIDTDENANKLINKLLKS